MSIFIIVFTIFYIILAKIRLDWAVILILAGLPTYLIRFSILGIPFTVLELMILIAFAVWLITRTKFLDFIRGKYKWKDSQENRKKRQRYPFDWEIVVLLLISYLAVGLTGFSDSAMGIWKAYFFEPALLFILVLNVFKKKEDWKKIIWPLAISALAISLFAIYQKFTGAFIANEFWVAEATRRVTSFFEYPNAVGLFLGPLILVLAGFSTSVILEPKDDSLPAGRQESRDKDVAVVSRSLRQSAFGRLPQDDKALMVFFLLVIFLSLISIVFAKSEGALVGVLAGLVVFGILAGKKLRIVTIIGVVVCIVGIMSYAPTRDYAMKKITLRDFSGEVRKQQWRETWQMASSNKKILFLGTGLTNYKSMVEPFHQEGIFFNKDNDPEFHRHVVWNKEYHDAHWRPVEIYLYPHNILLNFWTELGLLGMLLFVWIIGKFFVLGFRNLKSEHKYLTIGLIGAMIVIVVHGIVDVPYFKNDLSSMFWVFIALMGMINLDRLTKTQK